MFNTAILPENRKKLIIKSLVLPVLYHVSVFALVILSGMLMLLSGKGNPTESNFLEIIFYASLVFAIIVWRVIKGQRLFTQPVPWDQKRQLLIHLTLVVMVVYLFWHQGLVSNVISVFKGGLPTVLTTSWAAGSAGIFEEMLCRGLFLTTALSMFSKKTYGLTKSALLSSLLFGALHLMNAFEAEPLAVGQQVFYTICGGLALATLRIGYNNLWLPVLIHTLIDFFPDISEPVTASPWGELLLFFLPMAAISLYTLIQMDKQLRLKQEEPNRDQPSGESC